MPKDDPPATVVKEAPGTFVRGTGSQTALRQGPQEKPGGQK